MRLCYLLGAEYYLDKDHDLTWPKRRALYHYNKTAYYLFMDYQSVGHNLMTLFDNKVRKELKNEGFKENN